MSGLLLKSIAAGTMLFDHIGLLFGIEGLRVVGRAAFPLFAFLFVEGWYRTQDRGKYFLRMAFWAVLSQIPFSLMKADAGLSFHAYDFRFWAAAAFGIVCGWLGLKEKKPKLSWLVILPAAVLPGFSFGFLWQGRYVCLFSHSTNVLYTFVVSMILLYIIEAFSESAMTRRIFLVCAGVALTAAYGAMCDYSLFGPFLVLLLYYGRKKKDVTGMALAAAVWGICIYGIPGQPFFMISVLFATSLIWLYDAAKDGGSKRTRRLFYAFYPVHMLVLWVVATLLQI